MALNLVHREMNKPMYHLVGMGNKRQPLWQMHSVFDNFANIDGKTKIDLLNIRPKKNQTGFKIRKHDTNKYYIDFVVNGDCHFWISSSYRSYETVSNHPLPMLTGYVPPRQTEGCKRYVFTKKYGYSAVNHHETYPE